MDVYPVFIVQVTVKVSPLATPMVGEMALCANVCCVLGPVPVESCKSASAIVCEFVKPYVVDITAIPPVAPVEFVNVYVVLVCGG